MKAEQVTATAKIVLQQMAGKIEGFAVGPDFWPTAYRDHARNHELLLREWMGMPRGPLAHAMLDGAMALKDLARHALEHAIINGQLLRCYP